MQVTTGYAKIFRRTKQGKKTLVGGCYYKTMNGGNHNKEGKNKNFTLLGGVHKTSLAACERLKVRRLLKCAKRDEEKEFAKTQCPDSVHGLGERRSSG